MSQLNTGQDSGLAKIIGADASKKRGRYLKQWAGWGAVILIVAVALIKWNMSRNTSEVQYKTQTVQRGNISITVTATGNLTPTNEVQVGSELSGIIKTVEVDYNDYVKAGQVLARLETSKLEAQVQQSRASLESAQAKVLQVQATIKEAGNNLSRLKSVQKLSVGKAVAENDMDTAQAVLDRGLADETSAKASVNYAKAVLEANEADLSKAVIHSPINGIVLSRAVEPGQTVAASLQAPVLFTLAEDLAQMELHVDVDEADVGLIKEAQEATFTVDAFPGRTFPARITQVRFGSKTVSGVVTYATVLNVDNSALLLRPGMTATAEIIVSNVKNAILAPNAALRFTPPEMAMAGRDNVSFTRKLFPRPPHRTQPKQDEEGRPGKNRNRVFTLKNGQPIPIPVTLGSTDGTMTEIISGDVSPGMELITDIVSVKK